ncbi:dihydroorotase [candidate division LCP-89 bacterium B3_LCP]|uniref:Dihydroorotase n=1 Tax=candidate division LCP-89 bacterium B3_LCP TaxID=2012998 RepID=A0A532V1P7_UNCL8|nr:MAG: dihydroorotase [candidate division LCP-89 bacterium B3_LCP]
MEPIRLPKKYCLKGARLIDPVQGLDKAGDLVIENGVITEIGSDLSAPVCWDMQGAIICPGFFDLHVHLREPGFEDAETIRTGQEAAAAGGFTGMACMPNTEPTLDQAGVVRWVIQQADGFPVAVHPVAAVTKGRKGEELTEMVELRETGAVGFSDDGSPTANPEIMRRALEYSLLVKAPIISHAEDLDLSRDGAMHESETSTRLGLPGIPRISEDIATIRDIMLAEYTGGHLHLAHLSTEGALRAFEEAVKRGVRVTAEVTPHHLLLSDKAVEGYDTDTKMKPPLREESDRMALMESLKAKSIQAIATDHAPHTFESKVVPYDEAAFGVVGLETAVGLIWDRCVDQGVMEPADIVSIFSQGPRQVVGLSVPAIKAGAPMELTIFHPEESWQVKTEEFYSKSINSPFKGWELKGRPWGILKDTHWAGRVEPDFK